MNKTRGKQAKSSNKSPAKYRGRRRGKRTQRNTQAVPYHTATTNKMSVAADLQLLIGSSQTAKISFNTRTILGTTVYAPILAFYDNVHSAHVRMDLRPISTSSASAGELVARITPDSDPQQPAGAANLLEILGSKRLKLSSPGKLTFSWKPVQPAQMGLDDTTALFDLYFGVIGATASTNTTIEIRFFITLWCSEPINNTKDYRGWRKVVSVSERVANVLDLTEDFEQLDLDAG